MKLKYLFVSLGLIITLVFSAIFSFPDRKLHLIFCDVGQGDATLAVKGSTQILIDGGPSDKVLGCLSNHLPFWDREIEMVVVTHPEYDHLTGLVSVIERYRVKQLVSNSLVTQTGVFNQFRKEVIEREIPVYSPKAGDKIKIGSLEFLVLFPKEKLGDEIVWRTQDDPQVLGVSNYTGNFNETTIVSLLLYGRFKALLTGDIGEKQERELETKQTEVLKVAHHGSKYSTSQDFLEKIKPDLAVISVGASNRYGHPTSEVLERLKNLDVKILRTDIDGEIEIVSDGESWYTKDQ